MIIAIDGPAASGVIYSFPAIVTSLASCDITAPHCLLAPASLAICAALVLDTIVGVLTRASFSPTTKRWANRGLQTSFMVWLISTAVVGAFYATADPINTETEYPTLGLYFDLANWIFGVSLLTLAGFAGLRLGLITTQVRGADL